MSEPLSVKAEARFWAKVAKGDGCWLWQGATGDGYGQFWHPGIKRKRKAHRISYELLVGPIPNGLTIDHLCRVRHCVNPSHMEVVTNRENVLRGVGLSAQHARKTHCPQGHPYDEENTIWEGDRHGGRHRKCRTCRDARNRARFARDEGEVSV